MLTKFIEKTLKRAKYKLLADGTFYADISGVRGVWANSRTLEACREELREVLENWLLLKIHQGESVSGLNIDRRLVLRHA